MNNKIKVDIYGSRDQVIGKNCGGCGTSGGGCGKSGGCSSHGGGCSGCGVSKSGGSNPRSKTLEDMFCELHEFLYKSDVSRNVDLSYHDLETVDVLDNDDLRILLDRGFEPPFTKIDGILRYYGGISKDLVYKDIKELLEG